MAELTRRDRRADQIALATLVLIVAVIAGIVGGVVGARLANGGLGLAARDPGAAQVVSAVPQATVDWSAYNKRWQDEYLAMYPPKLDPKLVQAGITWQREYLAMHPPMLDPKWVQYGLDWQRQYEQQHPPH